MLLPNFPAQPRLIALTIFLLVFVAEAFPMQQTAKERSHRELKPFESFLDSHPSIAGDLSRDPSLLDDQNYLARHPDLEQFLKTHPGLQREIQAKAARCSLPIPSIFDRVSPAVVFIFATSINPYRMNSRVENFVGSGFIIDPSGLILTNSHVAFGRQSIEVRLEDGTSVAAQVVGADPLFDIAVLRIPKPAKGDLPAVVLGDSDKVHVGGEAIVIGNPMGLDQSLTRGTISAINRLLPVTFFSLQEPLIQIDTPINPGNSGGPLINQCGEVIGITTAKLADAQNIGFAIPINLVKAVLPSLVSQGRVIRPWLGFHGQIIDDGLQSIFRFPLVPGLMIEVVEPGSPAEKAGLKGGVLEITIAGQELLLGGDIITKMNGIEVNSSENLLEILQQLKVGANVSLTIYREGKELTISYEIPERPLLPGDFSSENTSFPFSAGQGLRLRPNGTRTGQKILR
jgi:serine protease Do